MIDRSSQSQSSVELVSKYAAAKPAFRVELRGRLFQLVEDGDLTSLTALQKILANVVADASRTLGPVELKKFKAGLVALGEDLRSKEISQLATQILDTSVKKENSSFFSIISKVVDRVISRVFTPPPFPFMDLLPEIRELIFEGYSLIELAKLAQTSRTLNREVSSSLAGRIFLIRSCQKYRNERTAHPLLFKLAKLQEAMGFKEEAQKTKKSASYSLDNSTYGFAYAEIARNIGKKAKHHCLEQHDSLSEPIAGAEKLPLGLPKVKVFLEVGGSYMALDQEDKAKEAFIKAAELARTLGNISLLIQIAYRQSDVDKDHALKTLQFALEIAAPTIEDLTKIFTCQIHLKDSRAEATLNIILKNGTKIEQLNALKLFTIILRQQGESKKEEEFLNKLNKLVATLKEEGTEKEKVEALTSLALVRYARGESQEMQDCLSQARERAEGDLLLPLARKELLCRQFKDANQTLLKALAFLHDSNPHIGPRHSEYSTLVGPVVSLQRKIVKEQLKVEKDFKEAYNTAALIPDEMQRLMAQIGIALHRTQNLPNTTSKK